MAKFYVNKFDDEKLGKVLKPNQCLIGLFKQCKTKGEGSFCGYYGAESYLDTELYAWYIADYTGRYDPTRALSLVQVCDPPIKYEKVYIATHMWTNVIHADDVNDAILKFDMHHWRQWSSLLDEIDAMPVARCPKCGKWPQLSHSYRGGRYEETKLECLSCKMYAKSVKGENGVKFKWNTYIKNHFRLSDIALERLCDPSIITASPRIQKILEEIREGEEL